MGLYSKLRSCAGSEVFTFVIIVYITLNFMLQVSVFHSASPVNQTTNLYHTLETTIEPPAKDNNTRSKNNPVKTRNYSRTEDRIPSRVVFFIGGGKSGSTTLAMYLKHDPNNWKVWDRNGQFLDGGKEFCWSMSGGSKEQFWAHFKAHGSKTAIFALDACPRAVEKTHFERMVKTFPNASYLLLVRDPVDRVISHMNDRLDTQGSRGSIEDLVKGQMSLTSLPVRLSMFGRILQNAYSILPKDKIMIVSNPEMKREPQTTIDNVMKHIGAKPKKITPIEANKRKDWETYQIPSNTTIKRLRDVFNRDWELFKNISGLNIDTVYM